MRLLIVGLWLALSNAPLVFYAAGVEEVCATCELKVLITGQFSHNSIREYLMIEGGNRRGAEEFREEINGADFALTVPNLEAGKYTVRFGFAETEFTNSNQRIFDISSSEQIIVTNFDIFATAGAANRSCFLTNQIEHAGDALRGPLTFTFTGRKGTAKFNTFEIRNSARRSIVFVKASDLINTEDSAALQPPVVSGPELWKDPSQPVDLRVRDLVSRLSLVEKAAQMRNGAPAIPRVGLPAYDYWNECLHGVGRAGTATVFPQAIGMAATWDVALLKQTADVIATEARAKHHEYARAHNGDAIRYFGLTFWTPNINIFRDPRWGRGQETYGEDPFLTARLGVAFIRGLQGDDPKYIKAMACAKHFAVHSGPESSRHYFDVLPSERDLYDTYLPHFEATVREGRVGAVMGAYNRVNGESACSSSFLLTELLRKQWGFDGHVVSDCGAIYDIFANHKLVGTSEEAAARAVKAGCDLCCGPDYNSLTRAVKAGLISEKDLDIAVGRLLEARFRLGLFDPPAMVSYSQIPITKNDSTEHNAVALRLASESIVLLKNNGLLPLDRTKVKRIAVIGTNANSVPMLLGNYNGTPSHPVTILDGIKAAAGRDVEVLYEGNCPLALRRDGSDKSNAAAAVTNALAIALSSDVIIYVGGLSPRLEGEEMRVDFDGFSGGDRTRIELPTVQTDLLKVLKATGRPIVFVNCSGSAVAMPWEAQNLPAILQAWYPGQAGGRAVADVLFGNVNPAGRLPVTFYRSTDDLPGFEDYSMSNRTYRYFGGTPLFAFGHGLSYTRFDYRHAKLKQSAVPANGSVRLTFDLSNSGSRNGEEVAQVYFRHTRSTAGQPKPGLCGFVRLPVARGKTAKVSLEIPVERFRRWDTTTKQYVVEPGKYEILLGAASDDIRARLPLKITPAH